MHRCSTQFLIYFILFLFSQGCYAQLCLEDGAVNEKLRDPRFIQRQLDCILAEHDQHCDQFGVQLKRIAPDIFRGTCVKPCTKCTQK
eukprot:07937.XXX_39809_40211_1 [CDS] Oithona nana genome sequencing.